MQENVPQKALVMETSLLAEALNMFPDDETARRWFEESRWPDGQAHCHKCGSTSVQHDARHPTMTHRCRNCGTFFSVRSGTVMQSSKLDYRVWAIAIFLITASPKGISGLRLHHKLGITRKSAWHLAHRLKKAGKAKALRSVVPLR